jgi:AGZA family xanthine/uracil permease-like MFS transporter
MAYLIKVPLEQVLTSPPADKLEMIQTTRCLANGFIVTSLLWGAGLAMMIDGRLRSAAVFFGVAGVCAFFGVIHSPLPSEQIGLPWDILQLLRETAPDYAAAVRYQTPYHWAAAYGLVVLMLLVTSLFPEHARSDPAKPQQANS